MQWRKEVKLDCPWDQCTKILESQWRLVQSDSSTANSFNGSLGSRTANEAHWHAVLLGYKKESKTETSVSRRCLQRRTAQMSEQNQSLLQYYNNIASLQDWPWIPPSTTRWRVIKPMTDLVKRDCSPGTHRNLVHTHRNQTWSREESKAQTDSCQRWSWTSRQTATVIAKQEQEQDAMQWQNATRIFSRTG